MTRVTCCMLIVAAIAGCRAPSPAIDPFTPYGQQRVPPPTTGTLGTPITQPVNPYYQGSGATTVAPGANNIGWHPTSTNLGTQMVAQGQLTAVQANPGVQVNPSTQGTTQVTAGSGTALPGQVTNPPVIRNTTPQPWQPSGMNTGTNVSAGAASPQLFRTNAPAQPNTNINGTIGNTLGINLGTTQGATSAPGTTQPNLQPNTQPTAVPTNTTPNRWGQPNTWGQPPTGGALQGMPINDATSAYPATQTPPWSLSGIRNWFRSQTAGVAQPAYPVQAAPGYPVQTATGYVYPNGTSVAGPVVNGVAQPNMAVPASYTTQPMGQPIVAPGTPPAAPAAMQWGAVPMASRNSGVSATSGSVTVRGNDNGNPSVASFVPSGQSSPLPHTAEKFGNHNQYHWLRGKLEYSSTQRRWKLRYIPSDAPEGRMDAYGGSVVLVEQGEQLQQFKPGDFVMVQGRLKHTEAGSNDFAPLYQVQAISGL